MNPIFLLLVDGRLRQTRSKSEVPETDERRRVRRVEIRSAIVELAQVLLGAAVAAFGLRGFLLPSHFIDGGVTGVSLLVVEMTGWPLAPLIVVINLPFLIMAAGTVSLRFAVRSLLGIAALGICVYAVPFPQVTTDSLLVAAFGGFFLGLGIGLAIRGGAILDGTEVLAIFVSRRTNLSVGNVILIINLVIFSTAAALLSVEVALYAVLTYFAAAKTIDFVIDGVEEYVAVTVVSPRSETLRRTITEVLGRGCTVYRGTTGYAPQGYTPLPTDILYTVISRLELARMRVEIDKVDPGAFVVMSPVMDARGGMLKKKPLDKLKPAPR